LSRSAEVGGPLPTGENQTLDLGATIPNSNAPQLRATALGLFWVAAFRNAAANATVASQQEWVSRPRPVEALLASTGSGQVIALYIFGCAIVSIAAMAALPNSRDRDFARDHI